MFKVEQAPKSRMNYKHLLLDYFGFLAYHVPLDIAKLQLQATDVPTRQQFMAQISLEMLFHGAYISALLSWLTHVRHNKKGTIKQWLYFFKTTAM